MVDPRGTGVPVLADDLREEVQRRTGLAPWLVGNVGPDMRLRDLAHSRTGDKGDTSNISVIAFDPEDFDLIAREVTAERVREHFSGLVTGEVTRFELPQLGALNFVMRGALRGGVTRSLALDAHGKCLGSAILDLVIEGARGRTTSQPRSSKQPDEIRT